MADTLLGKQALHEIYTLAQPDYTGRVTVPVLWDKKRQTIMNKESHIGFVFVDSMQPQRKQPETESHS